MLALVAHVIEVVAFAVGWLLLLRGGIVELSVPVPTLLDVFYFSGAVYTGSTRHWVSATSSRSATGVFSWWSRP